MMYLSFFNFDYSQSYARFSNVSKKRISLQATVFRAYQSEKASARFSALFLDYCNFKDAIISMNQGQKNSDRMYRVPENIFTGQM